MIAECSLIASVVAVGDRRPYVTALLVLDPDASALFATRHDITDPGPAALAAHPAIRTAVSNAVDAANRRLIKRFTILPAFWEPGSDEITPTMKLRRAAIAAKYADVIETIYARTD